MQKISRDNARQPIDWVEYERQLADPNSVFNFYRRLIDLWKNDPVLIHGSLKVKKTSRYGVFDFERHHQRKTYSIHLDFSGKIPSTLFDENHNLILSSR